MPDDDAGLSHELAALDALVTNAERIQAAMRRVHGDDVFEGIADLAAARRLVEALRDALDGGPTPDGRVG